MGWAAVSAAFAALGRAFLCIDGDFDEASKRPMRSRTAGYTYQKETLETYLSTLAFSG